MPFFWITCAVSYGGGIGLFLDGKPDVFTVEKKRKNYVIEARVKGKDDYYTINLTVSFEGSFSLTITSNNRSMISCSGEIYAAEKPVEKK